MTKKPKYSVGDSVWYVDREMVTRCTILSIDDWAVRKHNGIYFYWLDEPIGHAEPADELYDTKSLLKVSGGHMELIRISN